MKRLYSFLALSIFLTASLHIDKLYAQLATHVVISEVYGGGGNTGALYTNDFIELYNPTNVAVNLSGWSVQYNTATGSGSWSVTPLSGSIAPYSYYLIQENQGSGGTVPLPTPDVSNTTSMAATSGKVALLNSTTPLTLACPVSSSIIDLVGYGSTANCYEVAAAPAPNANNTTSAYRKSGSSAVNRGSGFDSNNNSTDFSTHAPDPQNSAAPAQQPSASTDYFRTKTSGEWNNITTWESSSTGSTDWLSASVTPDFSANTIEILNGHSITVTTNLTIDQTMMDNGSVVAIKPDISLTINDGAGTDLAINTGSNLIFQSDATGSGKLADIGSASITQDNNVTVQRYLTEPTGGVSVGRGWRLLAAPLKGSSNNSIFYNWQNNGANGVGNNTGVEIWGPNGTGISGNGLSVGPAYSIRSYDGQTNAYVNVTDTKNAVLFDGSINKPYLIFITGPYASGFIGSGSDPTTLNATGNLITGTQTYNFVANGTNNFALIANPYPCPIDFEKVFTNAGNLNIAPKFYVVDPNLNEIGGYVTVVRSGVNTYNVMPSSGATAQNHYIQSGQAFFVEASADGGAALEIKEEDKDATTAETNVFRTNNGSFETFAINLNAVPVNNIPVMIDGALVNCHNNYNLAHNNNEDADKFFNPNESIFILNSSYTFAQDGRPLVDNGDEIKIGLNGMRQRNYQLEIKPDNINAPYLTATLFDNFLNSTVSVSLTSSTVYPFTVTANAASGNNNRFKIVFSGTPLDFNFLTISATQKNNEVILNWEIDQQEGIAIYEVERSNDGKNFTRLSSVEINAANSYSYIDNSPFAGNNFYRIKAISRNKSGVYSKIVTVKINEQGTINIFPNPATGASVQVYLNNLEAGVYNLGLYNGAGQKSIVKQISGNSSAIVETFYTGNLAPGIYFIKLSDGKGQVIAVQKLIIK